ncbi:MAG: hypothetical protein U0872_09070 [Planctomycetaceae bacterium]
MEFNRRPKRKAGWPVSNLGICLAILGLATQPICGQEFKDDPLPARSPQASLAVPNLHLVVREDFLNRIAAGETVQTGDVQDTFEDTIIRGTQVTKSTFRVDLKPSSTQGRAWVVVDGQVNSNTQGYNSKAIVNTLGHQQFHAVKEVLFDGYQLATRHAEIQVRADNQSVGAVTHFTGRPLGPLVERVILNIAESRKVEANDFARQRLADELYPRFDGEIDQKLSEGNRLLKSTVQPWLRQTNTFPDRIQVLTTETHAHVAIAVAAALDMQTPPPVPSGLLADHGVSLYVHDSLLQGLVERFDLAGKKINTRDLPGFKLGVENEQALSGLPDLNVHIELAEVDPITVELLEDEARVVIRAGFQIGGQALLPALEIALTMQIREQGDQWEVHLTNVQVQHLDGSSSGNSLAELAVKKVIEANFTKQSFPRQLPANYWPEGKTPPEINSIRLSGGWLVIGAD